MVGRDAELKALLRAGEEAVRYEARRQRRRLGHLIELEEAEAVGREVLAKALPSYDPASGPFAPYVRKRVAWAILASVRRDTHGDRCVGWARTLFIADLSHEAFEEDLETDEVLTEAEQQTFLETVLNANTNALGVGILAERHEAGIVPPVATPEEQLARAQQSQLLYEAIDDLPDRERSLVLRYLGDETMSAIAADLALSKSWASRLFERAFAKLRRALTQTC